MLQFVHIDYSNSWLKHAFGFTFVFRREVLEYAPYQDPAKGNNEDYMFAKVRELITCRQLLSVPHHHNVGGRSDRGVPGLTPIAGDYEQRGGVHLPYTRGQ